MAMNGREAWRLPRGLRAWILAVFLLGWQPGAMAAKGNVCPSTPPEPRNILILGNSLSAQITPALYEIIGSGGHAKPRIFKVSTSGGRLQQHLSHHRSAHLLASRDMDVVILQENSIVPTSQGNPDEFKRNAAELARRAQQANPCVRVLLFQPWARRPGNRLYAKAFGSAEQMHAELRGHFRDAVQHYLPAQPGARGYRPVALAPVGEAWAAGWGDLALADPYAKDGGHPSYLGHYLSSLVLYSTIYQRPVKGLSAWKLEPAAARHLQQLADEATGFAR